MKNKTRLGISTFSYPYAVGIPGFLPEHRMDMKELIDKAAELEVQVVQIADNYPLHLLSREEQEEISKYAADKKIALEIGTRGSQCENLVRYIDISQRMNARLLRAVLDSEGDKPCPEEIVRRIGQVLPLLEEKKIVLGIENHDRIESHVFAQIMGELNSSYVGIVLDTVNSFGCEEGTKQVVDELARYTVNFHMKDFRIDRIPSTLGFRITGTIAGEGRLRMKEIVSTLEECGQSDFTTVLELWMEPEPTIEATIQKENCWVEQSVRNMKRILCEDSFLNKNIM